MAIKVDDTEITSVTMSSVKAAI